MGAAMGKSQEAGSFFQFSEELIPVVQSTIQRPLCSGGLLVDFEADWKDYLRETGLPSYGLDYKNRSNNALEKNTMGFLNARRRVPPAQPRKVLESRELRIPDQYSQDYSDIKKLIEAGNDLTLFLSRDLAKHKRPDIFDFCLNTSGFQHLHFKTGGTKHVLFCMITNSTVFVIQAYLHKSADQQQWVRMEPIEIMHKNWPEEIAYAIVRGLPSEEGEDSIEKRVTLCKDRKNFFTRMKDGTLYSWPGGGINGANENAEDRTNCAKIFSELKSWQQIIENNEARFRDALKWPQASLLWIKAMFDCRKLCIYEATTGVRIAINVQTNG
jgi:hypothetical protein